MLRALAQGAPGKRGMATLPFSGAFIHCHGPNVLTASVAQKGFSQKVLVGGEKGNNLNLSQLLLLCCSSQGEDDLDIIRKCINRSLDRGSELMEAVTNMYLIWV